MISTGKKGRPVAAVSSGTHKGTIIRLVEEKSDVETKKRDMEEVLDDADLIADPAKFRMLSLADRRLLAAALERGELESSSEDDETEEEECPRRRVQHRIAKTFREKQLHEFRLTDGTLTMLPSEESERVFIAGRSGAGKSYISASYMRTYHIMFPGRRIFLLSTHDGEAAYEDIDHTQIALDDGFVENPPGLTELKDSLVVFDDCDNLTQKKISDACKALNNSLISDGRKYNIHVVTLSHMLMDHDRTRKLLNEAQRVIFFPQGNAHHNRRYLKEYAGMEANWVKKILKERSRWVCIDFRAPKSYLTENAVVVIR